MPAGDEEQRGAPIGFRDRSGDRSAAESLGEALLGSLLDRAHLIPPRLVGPLVAQEVGAAGGDDVAIHLQDHDQVSLQPLEGRGMAGRRVPIHESPEGRAFSTDELVEAELPDGRRRLHLPMLDGSDRVGVLSVTLPAVSDGDRRLAQRLAGLVADLVVTKSAYTDAFELTRATRPMTLSARLQRDTLPPLAMTTPDVDLAGILEPAYEVGGDSFDYALDEHLLHVAVFDAMGHGLEAATMATVVIAAYRHGRQSGAELTEIYERMDHAVAATFPGRFATAQIGRLDTAGGELSWVNAGHPAPLHVRGGRVVGELTGPITRPVGLADGRPARVQTARLEPADRVLFFTDGVVEERVAGEQFGEARLREVIEETTAEGLAAAETVRRLSHALMAARRGAPATTRRSCWSSGSARPATTSWRPTSPRRSRRAARA
ncbi:PP2C family protein-serine/threonine phosphatase [Blastococcus sp. SYSU D00669]